MKVKCGDCEREWERTGPVTSAEQENHEPECPTLLWLQQAAEADNEERERGASPTV